MAGTVCHGRHHRTAIAVTISTAAARCGQFRRSNDLFGRSSHLVVAVHPPAGHERSAPVGDILDGDFAHVVEGDREPVTHLVAHGAAHTDAARIGETLEP